MRRFGPVTFIVAALAAVLLLSSTSFAEPQPGAGEPPAAGNANGAAPANGTAPAAEKGEEVPEAAKKGNFLTNMWEGFKTNWQLGGWVMWGLALLAVVGIYFMVDRFIRLRRDRIAPVGLANRANSLWHEGQFDDLIRLGRNSNSTLGRVIVFLVAHRNNSYEHLTQAAEDIAGRDFELHERSNYPLSAVGTVAPLLGLLGTVFGLLGAFATINVVGSMDDPSALAGDIGEALVTTAAGLILAIPALLLYHYFVSRTSYFAGIVGEEVSAMMHEWFLSKAEGGSKTPPPAPREAAHAR